jgi:thiamine-monophosphate kinase
LTEFAAGLASDQKTYGIHLLGGDSVSSPSGVSVGITAFGYVPDGRSLLRRGARPGDGLYVSGSPGDAVLGLHLLQNSPVDGLKQADEDHLTGRYHLPEPRVALGQRLNGIASAALDLSDGLAGDLGHICSSSGVAATVSIDLMPWSPSAQRLLGMRPDLLSLALAGGDDYELLFTAPMDREAEMARISEALSVPITRIGVVEKGTTIRFLDGQGQTVEGLSGWQHF